jgi:hypothetical protein
MSKAFFIKLIAAWLRQKMFPNFYYSAHRTLPLKVDVPEHPAKSSEALNCS